MKILAKRVTALTDSVVSFPKAVLWFPETVTALPGYPQRSRTERNDMGGKGNEVTELRWN